MKKFLYQSLFMTVLLVLGTASSFAEKFTVWNGTPDAQQVEGQENAYTIDLSGKFADYESISSLVFTYAQAATARTNNFNESSWIVGSEIIIFAGEDTVAMASEEDILVANTTVEIAIDEDAAAKLLAATTVTVWYKNLQVTQIDLEGTVPTPFDINTGIANAGFEDCTVETTNWATAGTPNSADYASTGWKLAGSAAWSSSAVVAYGGTGQINGVSAPASDNAGNTGNTLGISVGWGGTITYQSASYILPAGTYTLKANVYNGLEGVTQIASKLGFVPADGNAVTSSIKAFAYGEWQVDSVVFVLTEDTKGKFQIGGQAISGGSGSNAKIFIDNLTVSYKSVLEGAKELAFADIAALPVGEGLFCFSENAVNTAKNAVDAATSVEEIENALATLENAQNKPEASKAYSIVNTTANGLMLSIGEDKVVLAENAGVYFTEVEGGWVLSNINETPDYMFKTTDNDWTLSDTLTLADAYVVNFNIVEGGYTIQGAKGLIGSDATAAGSSLYADKTADKNGVWTITEYVEPVEPIEPAYGTIWTPETSEPTKVDGTESYKIELPIEHFKNFVQANDTLSLSFVVKGQEATSRRIITTGSISLKVGESTLAEQTEIASSTISQDFAFTADQIATINGTDAECLTVVYTNMTISEIALKENKEVVPTQLIPDGKYYLVAMELENNNLMAAGMNWGTQGIVNGQGIDIQITFNQEQNGYTFDTNIYNNNNHFLGSNLFMDSPSFLWSIEEDAVYGHCIYAMIDGVKKYISVATDGRLALSETAYAWGFMKAEFWESTVKAEGLEAMKDATAEKGVDATFLIKDANFNRGDHRWEAWTVSEDCTNKDLGGGCDANNGNGCAESYHSTFTISQALADAPKGIYSMTAQGFYRQDGGATEDAPVFFANDSTATVPVLTGSEGSMTNASYSFSEGKYAIEQPIFVEVAEGATLTVGVKGTASNQWVIWDNFQLTYYGPDATMDEVKNGAIVKELAELREKATALKDQVEVEAVKTALESALTQTEGVTGSEAINAAIETLKTAIDLAEASIIAKDVLPKMKQLTETTNVYTQEAYDAYYTQWVTKYNEGTLTKAEATANVQDPFLVTSWRANITVDNFLLSAWDTNPDFVEAPYYINSWSTEGENDGSEFKVPFFEYWINDDQSLGEKTLTATMTGLEAGDYEVKALVRVRMKNGATAPTYGITMQANDGEAIDVAAGDQIGSSQLYLKEFTATGTVAEDGTLKIKFIVAADNNISWLAFKNVMFTKNKPEPQPEEGVLYSWESPEGTPIEFGGTISYENGEGDRLNYLNAGYYTICLNGKKANLNDTEASASAGHMLVTLDNPVSNEYKVELTAYINKNATDKKASAWFQFENGNGIESAVYSDEANIDPVCNGSITTTEFVIPEDANGSKSFKMTRGQSGTNLFITKLVIKKASDSDGISTMKADSKFNGAIYNLNGQKVEKATKGLYIINGKKVVIK